MPKRTAWVSSAVVCLLSSVAWGCRSGSVDPQNFNPQTVGDLPSPVASMTGDQLWTEGKRLGWALGKRQDRECRDGECKGRVDAVFGQEAPGPSRISSNGTIVARFANLGAWGGLDNRGPEAKYGTTKGGSAMFLLIAIPNASAPDGWSWIVREARVGDTGTTPVRNGSWLWCTADQHNPDHPPAGTKSQFYKCIQPQNGNGNGGAVTALSYSISDPGWLECEMGCCTAGS